MFSKRIARTLVGQGSEVLDGMRGSVLKTFSRDFSGGRKTVLITGASRGIGYAITKLITNTLDNPMVYGTSRNSAEQLTDLIREEVDAGKEKCVEFRNMEVSDTSGIMALRNHIELKHGQIDVLINNAGMYFYPAMEATEHFVQVQRTLDINYWGMKNVISSFLSVMSDQSRIVNMSSFHGHLSRIPGRSIQMQLGDSSLTEKRLDDLMMDYQRHSTEFNYDFEEVGWPRCAYTVSKVAVNAYTRILQRQLEEKGRGGIVVNSIHPGSYHSKITQNKDYATTPAEAAKSVVEIALQAQPQSRGKFLGPDLSEVNWDMETNWDQVLGGVKTAALKY